MRYSLSISFLLVGLPILFILREYILIDKSLFTYTISGFFVLLLFPKIKNPFIFYTDNLLISHTLFSIFLIFGLYSFIESGINAQFIDLSILLFIWINFHYIQNHEFKNLYLYLYYLSVLSVLSVYFFNLETSIHVGRIYAGDSKNPNLISWIAMINILIGFLIFFNYQNWKKLFIIPMLLISMYIYLESFSKSSFLGLIIISVVYLFKYRSVLNIKNMSVLFLSTITLFLLFKEKIFSIINKVASSIIGLFSGESRELSANMRYENFNSAFSNISFSNIVNFKMNSFRLDSPILQVMIEFGNVFGIILFFILLLIPIYYILHINIKVFTMNQNAIFLIYLFLMPNILFHGSAYELMTWLPTILFYKFIVFTKEVKNA